MPLLRNPRRDPQQPTTQADLGARALAAVAIITAGLVLVSAFVAVAVAR